MAYATAAQMITRYDARTIGELVADDGTRVTGATLLADPNLAVALDDASGQIDAALMQSNRYSADDLSGLTGNSAAHLQRITCDLAMGYLYARRPMYDVDSYQKFMELGNKILTQLRKGENVFNLSSQKDAGTPSVDGPTTVDYARLNLLPDRIKHFFPSRGSRLPTNRR